MSLNEISSTGYIKSYPDIELIESNKKENQPNLFDSSHLVVSKESPKNSHELLSNNNNRKKRYEKDIFDNDEGDSNKYSLQDIFEDNLYNREQCKNEEVQLSIPKPSQGHQNDSVQKTLYGQPQSSKNHQKGGYGIGLDSGLD